MMSDNCEKRVNSSPERHTFQAKSSKEKLAKNPEDQSAKNMVDWLDKIKIDEANKIFDPEWQRNNLEYDLRSTGWICDKVKLSKIYAQNLYCALCNREFQKLDVIPILKDEKWGCSWRHAGGIIADMLETGDYIDWYCSGITNDDSPGLVSEGFVTDEIRKDLEKLGWSVLDEL